MQFAMLVREGIYPWSRVLDIGCGCLRGGYWLIHFLNRNGYYGIEPNTAMVQAGFDNIVEPEVARDKRPVIESNDTFDASVFGVEFDAFLARSIWTHASKPQICTMLDNFVRHTSDRAFFLASYLPARWPWEDYKGIEYRGKSHNCNVGDLIKHRYEWIEAECKHRNLYVRQLPDGVLLNQRWLKIAKQPLSKSTYSLG
jgi:SAM-dependent methyltransferase